MWHRSTTEKKKKPLKENLSSRLSSLIGYYDDHAAVACTTQNNRIPRKSTAKYIFLFCSSQRKMSNGTMIIHGKWLNEIERLCIWRFCWHFRKIIIIFFFVIPFISIGVFFSRFALSSHLKSQSATMVCCHHHRLENIKIELDNNNGAKKNFCSSDCFVTMEYS